MNKVFKKYEQIKQENLAKYGDTLKGSGCWERELNDGMVILDADGWDRSNFDVSWSEKITLKEFYNRRDMSTTCGSITT